MAWLGDPELDTARMWKIYETFRMDVAGSPQKGIEKRFHGVQQWLTVEEFASLQDAINNQHVSGEAARHATHQVTAAVPIGLGQARKLLIKLVKRWHRDHLSTP